MNVGRQGRAAESAYGKTDTGRAAAERPIFTGCGLPVRKNTVKRKTGDK
jgi:hypothetical protein